MKKLLSVFFALLLACAFTAGAGSAEDSGTPEEPERVTSGVFVYIVRNDGTAEIVDRSGIIESLVIPEELDGHRVTRIGDMAFRQSRDLTSVTIPDSVTEIGDNPFYLCGSLAEIVISPDHPTLETVDGVLFSKPDRRLVFYPIAKENDQYTVPDGTQVIGKAAFSTCDALHSVTIPGSVTVIGDLAFNACRYLSYIGIPYGPTVIGSEAFSLCFSLKGIVIPGSVTAIGKGAFRACTHLTSVTIPDSVAEFGDNPFSNCTALREITVSPLNPYLRSVNGVLFSKPDMRLLSYLCGRPETEYTVPDGTTGIANDAFAFNPSLTAVTIPGSVTEIGDRAFQCCDALVNITIPDSVTAIGDNAFDGCASLKEIRVPGSVESIGQLAFCGCTSLQNAVISEGVKSIGYYAFGNCDSLTSIALPESLTDIGDYAFSSGSALTVSVIAGSPAEAYCIAGNYRYVQEEKQPADPHAFPEAVSGPAVCGDYEYMLLSDGTAEICAYNGWETELVIPGELDGIRVTGIGEEVFRNRNGLTKVTIPESVVHIGQGAFRDCHYLAEIDILGNITGVEDYTFHGCRGLRSMKLPETVQFIGNDAFSDCGYMWRINIPGNVKTIGDFAFYYCFSLAYIEVPDGVTDIGQQAFSLCDELKNVTIPASVTNMGMGVFYQSPVKVTVIPGSYAEDYCKTNHTRYVNP